MKLLITFFSICFFSCHDKNARIFFPDGGYGFPTKVEAKDSNFIYYPLKNLISRRDSFNEATYGYAVLHAMKEPNLSLRPEQKIIFRLTYIQSSGPATIINLTENEISVKVSRSMLYVDTGTRLTALEFTHLNLLEYNFPLSEGKRSPSRQHRVDSMVRLNPQLLDPAYYRSLLDKTNGIFNDTFRITTKKISISKKEFNHVVNLINLSGFWKMPYRVECELKFSVMDGYEFILEANTGYKYNVVKYYTCHKPSTNFDKACQELIDLAGLGDETRIASF